VAIALLRGAAGVREFSEPVVSDADIAAFRTKVRAEADDAIPVEVAVVAVRTRGGQVVEAHVRNARGSLETPLTDDELEAKVRDLASMTVPHVDVSRLIEAVWALDATDDAGAVMALAVPAPMQG
jgi:2-methylcitrate dehydratase PrpD